MLSLSIKITNQQRRVYNHIHKSFKLLFAQQKWIYIHVLYIIVLFDLMKYYQSRENLIFQLFHKLWQIKFRLKFIFGFS
jgi:hypothetical protein